MRRNLLLKTQTVRPSTDHNRLKLRANHFLSVNSLPDIPYITDAFETDPFAALPDDVLSPYPDETVVDSTAPVVQDDHIPPALTHIDAGTYIENYMCSDSGQNGSANDWSLQNSLPVGWMNQHLEPASPELPDLFATSADPTSGLRKSGEEEPRSAPPERQRHGSRRGLPRRRSRYFIDRSGKQASPIAIPSGASTPDPLRRWQESPPEEEPAPLSAIKDAVQGSLSEQSTGIPDQDVANAFRNYRRPASRAGSTTSAGSATSASSRQSGTSSSSRRTPEKKTGRVRKTRQAKKDKPQSADDIRPFCCTFCCDKFKSKYDWMRHEKSLHLNLENWICAPYGGTVLLPSTNRVHCAYCNQLDPTAEHLNHHNHGACDGQQRSFRRKDHLVQHLRLFHRLETLPLIDDWKTETINFTSRCGFCDRQMSNRPERYKHLAGHFRSGLTMADWKGDHEFPESIAAKVTCAVPPYLIDLESRTVVPFSATNSQAKDHFSQMLSRASFRRDADTSTSISQQQTQNKSDLPVLLEQLQVQDSPLNSYTQILTLHLSHYAQEQIHLGIVPTDEMFQQEARHLFYDCDDPWNQTIADHPQWLAAFREQQCHHGSIGLTDHTTSDPS